MNSRRESISPRWFVSWVYERACRRISGRSPALRAWRRWWRFVRVQWLRWGDPPVEFSAEGFGKLRVPFSHDLGLAIALYPDYSRNLGRLAAIIREKHPRFAAIDVGANVGDSVRMLRMAGCERVLAIEGAQEFLPYLRANTGGDRAVEIEAVFVGVPQGFALRRRSARGSSHFEPDASGESVSGDALSVILGRHPDFNSSRLLKLDTDGLDLEIVAANLDWLRRIKAVLFFEYLPYFFRRHGSDPEGLFAKLNAAGYRTAVVYDNFGGFVRSISTGPAEVRELIAFFERDHDEYYADLAIFHEEDQDLAERLTEVEIRLSGRRTGGESCRPSGESPKSRHGK